MRERKFLEASGVVMASCLPCLLGRSPYEQSDSGGSSQCKTCSGLESTAMKSLASALSKISERDGRGDPPSRPQRLTLARTARRRERSSADAKPDQEGAA